MKKREIFFLAILLLIFSSSLGFCADTEFFGSIETRLTSNNHLTDATKELNDSMDYADTKLVLGITNNFNEYLRGVAAFEVGSIIWGIDGEDYPVGKNTGGSASGDGVNIETKNIYLDVDVPSHPINFKVGLMPFNIANRILAGDDAFGLRLTVGNANELNATLNVVRTYQESLGTRYNLNADDPDRRENLLDLEASKTFNEYFKMSGLFAYLVDRYDGVPGNEINRDIYYFGVGFSGGVKKANAELNFILGSGSIESSDVQGNAKIDNDIDNPYLIDFIAKSDFESVGVLIECLYASGDNPDSNDEYEGFIVPETSYRKDIAEILTRGVLSDELVGDEDYAAYKYTKDLSNIYFVKGAINFKITKKTSTSLAVIYAGLPKEITINDSERAKKVGTEIDWKLTHTIYAADDQKKGLRAELIVAYLISGDVFDVYDPIEDTTQEGSNISEYGARLVYEF